MDREKIVADHGPAEENSKGQSGMWNFGSTTKFNHATTHHSAEAKPALAYGLPLPEQSEVHRCHSLSDKPSSTLLVQERGVLQT